MRIDTNTMVSITEANQNFSKVARKYYHTGWMQSQCRWSLGTVKPYACRQAPL